MFFQAACTEFDISDVSKSIKVQPDISVYPEQLDFDVVLEGQSSSQIFTISSIGNATVEIQSLEIVGSGSYSIQWEQEPFLLEPNESRDIVVTYHPNSINEFAGVHILNNGIETTKIVGLQGSGSYPAISVTPNLVSLYSTQGESVFSNVLIKSIGTAPLEIFEYGLFGDEFEVFTDIPIILEPEETHEITVWYHPDNDSEKDIGNLWLSHNTELASSMVYLEGMLQPDCYGLSEAWDRGILDIHTTLSGSIVFEHIGQVEEPNICMDEWYVLLSENSQDAGVGDPFYDPGGTYPNGTITLEPSQSISFFYQGSEIPAWYCMELTQSTFFTYQWEFLGARVPEPILSMMLSENQQGVWDWMDANPTVILGRENHVISAKQDESVVLRIFNMGQVGTEAIITETIPPEFEVYFVSHPPTEMETLDDGTTIMTFDVSLPSRELTEIDLHTLYQEVHISYKIQPKVDACFGRFIGNSPVAQWLDSSGTWRFSDASPIVILCE